MPPTWAGRMNLSVSNEGVVGSDSLNGSPGRLAPAQGDSAAGVRGQARSPRAGNGGQGRRLHGMMERVPVRSKIVPIYEYVCRSCDKKFDQLVGRMSSAGEE